jgi:hypothetical protein
MPTIQISEATFSRLQAFATPLVDTIETALAKVLSIAEQTDKTLNIAQPTQAVSAGAPDLTHTTVKSASVSGKVLGASLCNWNALMMTVVEEAAKQLPKGTSLTDLLVVNHIVGKNEDNGYKFLKSAGISIQGQNSNNAWKAISHLAKAVGLRVEVSFVWSEHPKAARPGQPGKLAA